MRQSTVNAQGLFDTLHDVLQSLGIQAMDSEKCTRLVGIGTDGASANIAGGGLNGLIEAKLPWMFWMWCLAHRMERADLKECLELVDGGLMPITASGSRWIGHKWNAMKYVVSRYGAYSNHLAAMSEDPCFKPAYRMWTNAKYIVGCAFLSISSLLVLFCLR